MMVIAKIGLALFVILYLVCESIEHKFIKDTLEIQDRQIYILNERIKILEQLKENK